MRNMEILTYLMIGRHFAHSPHSPHSRYLLQWPAQRTLAGYEESTMPMLCRRHRTAVWNKSSMRTDIPTRSGTFV